MFNNINKLNDFLKNRIFTEYHIFEMIFSLCCLYVLQFSNQSITYTLFPVYIPYFLFIGAFFIAWFMMFIWLKFFEVICKSMRKAGVIVLSLCSLLGLINYYDLKNRSMCFTIYDLFSANTVLNVFDINMLKPDKYIIPMLLCIAFGFFLIFGLKIGKKCVTSLYKKIIYIVTFVVFNIMLLGGVIGNIVNIDFYRVHDSTLIFSCTYPISFFNDAGQILKHNINTKDNLDVAENVLSQYSTVKNIADDKVQNLIIIMGEAYAIIPEEYGLVLEEDPYAYIKELSTKSNVKTGNVATNVFGGGTADSECEFLTGVSAKYYLEQAGLYNIYLKGDHNTIFESSFDDAVGSTAGIHLWRSNGYRRKDIYPNVFKFDTVIFGDDYGKTCRDICDVRDEFGYEEIIGVYEQNKKDNIENQFIFNVSTQAHMMYKYAYDIDYVLPEKNKQYDAWQIDQFNCYLNEIHDSSSSLQTLIDYFSNIDENTIIVYFGDHQPGFDTLSITDILDGYEPYMTDYLIWSNYDIDFNKIPEYTSVNYFGTNICDAAGLDLSPYQMYLLDLQSKYGYFTRHHFSDMSEEDDKNYNAICESYVFNYDKVKQYFDH